MKLIGLFWLLCSLSLVKSNDLSHYRNTIFFKVFSKQYPEGVISSYDDTIYTSHCNPQGNVTIIAHAWYESINKSWVKPMIDEFLKLRGNCVYFMDYSHYALGIYFTLVPHFDPITDILTEKILKVANPENLVMFGFSFGARLITRAGAIISGMGMPKVDKIYACEPAAIGFEPFYNLDPKTSANFVSCIHTSHIIGTKVYDCHQNWRMGVCGYRQIGARSFPYGSHGLCPYIFLSSFKNDIYQNNYYKCKAKRKAKFLPKDFKLGPREIRTNYTGEIFAPTSKNYPFVWKKHDGPTKIITKDFHDLWILSGGSKY